MAEIFGTPGPDQLDGTEENDIIRGGRGEDSIYGGLGDDILYGGLGNDHIFDRDGRSEIYGGKGSDSIDFVRGIARGGYGNEQFTCFGGGWSIGGPGNDTFESSGAVWGDAGPGVQETFAGNDKIFLYADRDGSWAHGGLGADQFFIAASIGDAAGSATIDDFRPGEDKINITLYPPDGESPSDQFNNLDANHNGILEYTDSLSGGGVYVDVTSNTMFLVVEDDLIVVHGTQQITTADWQFGGPDWIG